MDTTGSEISRLQYIYIYIDPNMKSSAEVFFRVIHNYKNKYAKKIFVTSQYKERDALLAIVHYKISQVLDLMLSMRQDYLTRNVIRFYTKKFPRDNSQYIQQYICIYIYIYKFI